MLRDVVFQVTLNSANVHGIKLGSVQVVHDFVGSEETERVGQVLEVLDDPKDAGKVVGVIAGPWLGTVNTLALQGRIDIENHVNSGSVEDGGAFGMVEFGVNVVYSNGVHL